MRLVNYFDGAGELRAVRQKLAAEHFEIRRDNPALRRMKRIGRAMKSNKRAAGLNPVQQFLFAVRPIGGCLSVPSVVRSAVV